MCHDEAPERVSDLQACATLSKGVCARQKSIQSLVRPLYLQSRNEHDDSCSTNHLIWPYTDHRGRQYKLRRPGSTSIAVRTNDAALLSPMTQANSAPKTTPPGIVLYLPPSPLLPPHLPHSWRLLLPPFLVMAASALPPALRGLAVSSVAALRARLPLRGPLLGLDITPTHVGAALSDGERTTAAPFGALARSAPALDARTLRLALAAPATHPALSRRGAVGALDSTDNPAAAIVPAALVVGVAPGGGAAADVAAYVADLVGASPEPFPGLVAVLFWEEADIVQRVLPAVDDYEAAMAFVGGGAAGTAGGGEGEGEGGGARGTAPRPRYIERRWTTGRSAQLRPRRVLTGAPRVAAANRISASELVEVVLAELRVSAARGAAEERGAG